MRVAGSNPVVRSTKVLVIRHVNEVLRRDGSIGEVDTSFVTMLFARLRPRPGRLEITLASAGHSLPFLVRADGAIERPGRHGVMLGVLPDPRTVNDKVVLDSGDTFLVVTDGVLEARNRDGVELDEHLADVLASVASDAAGVIVGTVEQAALDWQGGRPSDDIAIVAVRVPDQIGAAEG